MRNRFEALDNMAEDTIDIVWGTLHLERSMRRSPRQKGEKTQGVAINSNMDADQRKETN